MSDQLKELYDNFPLPGTIVCFDIGDFCNIGMVVDIIKTDSPGIHRVHELKIIEPSDRERIRSYPHDAAKGKLVRLVSEDMRYLHAEIWDEWIAKFNKPLLPDRLHDLRISRGLSMNALGERICSNGKAISKYERGEASPNRKTVLKLAICLGTSIGYLCGWD